MDEAEIDDKARLTAEMAFQEDSTAVIRRRQSLPDNPVTVILSVLMVLLTVAATMVKVTGLNPNRLLGLHSSQQNMIHAAATYRLMDSALLLFLIFRFHRSRRSLVYLVDFSCHKPEDQFKTSRKRFVKLVEESGSRHEESIKFVRRITSGACMGDESYLPRGSTNSPPIHNIEEARAESETSIFGALDSLFDKTALKPCDIDILVLNSSLFSLVPSLSSMIVNHYKLRTDIKTYNLGGMGCSAGLVSIDLANTILRGNPDSYAVVVSTENINENWYQGNDRSMLISLCLFRWGTSAVLLSNKARDRSRSKYELLHLVRTHTGANEKHFDCAAQREDEFGIVGISLSKELMAAAGEALKTNIFSLGRLVLPCREQLRFLVTLVLKKVFKSTRKVKPYTPDFKLAFEHFCIHTGGRAVLDAMQKNLELDDWRMEPSRMTLHRFGNTSSSSLWYELAYTEAKGRVRRGDRVWQLGFGSGFKCNSAVWRALRDISVGDWRGNPWDDSIDKYPVKLTTSS